MRYGSHQIKKRSKGLYKALALLLCFATLITSFHFGIVAIIAEAAEGSHSIQFGGKNIDSIVLPQDDKRTLSVEEQADTAYSWQLCIDKSNDEWVTVSGQKKNFLTLSYAMVGSLLDSHGTAYVRSIMKSGGNTSISSPVCINVSYTAPEAVGQSETVKNPLKSSIKRANAAPSDFKSYTVTVNFVYENGDLVSDPYVANIEDGGQFSTTVHFPSVVGYLAYLGDDANSSTELQIDIPEITENVSYTVTYKPTLVSYKVHHYVQNILDDNYVLNSTTERMGLTGTSVGDGCAIVIDGFTVLYYDKDVKIAADGSTEIEIYYDRNYYLLSFDLDGGYGVEPIYTRYGATVSVSAPTRPGYLFDGWELTECGGVPATDAQKSQYDLNLVSITLPSMNLKYRAKWKTSDTTYTVVYWTENADDDGYSYESHETVNAVSGTVVNGSAYSTRTIAHFTYNADETDNGVIVEGDGSTVVNVYYSRNQYTLSFRATVYNCDYEEHTHTYDGRYRSGWTWYYYGGCYPEGSNGSGGATSGNTTCGKQEHTHSYRCSTSVATVATITAKYDSKIFDEFNKEPFSTTYSGRAWECTDSNKYDYPLQTLDRMPEFDATFDLYDQSSTNRKIIYYYVQKVGTSVDANVWPTSNNDFDLLKQVYTYFNYATYDEEYHTIKGFDRYTESVSGFGRNYTYPRKDFSNNTLTLYYLRKSYSLNFFNYTAEVSGKGGILQYEAPLKDYYFVPDYPDSLEPNAYEFAGWFTTPGCFAGSEVDFSTATMPDSDVTLYAKWAPKTHTVRIFKTATMADAELIDTQTIPHGNYAKAPTDITNGNYVFNGWFYMDGTEKKAFDFNNMPVNRDLDIFAEWSSKTAVLYTVRYELADGTEIAEPTVGSTLAGTSKTFTAKGGAELYAGYQEGYFPNTNSHTILMNINGGNEYTFIYTPIPNVPYTVRYLERGTGNVLAEEKQVAENKKSVVTEVFKQIAGYMPDAYQKRLVLSANGTENVLTFWYTKDDIHAYYIITHWVQNLVGDGYTEYRTIQGPGTIGETITETPLSITGYTYNSSKSTASGLLTADGLELNLYYDRNLYGYTVKYLEYGTDKKLHAPSDYDAIYRYGTVVSAEAVAIPGYTVVGEKNKTRTISNRNNEILFYYSEQEVTINYVPIGSGFVSIGSETVKAATGSVSGSVPTPAFGYRFDGWFADEACTIPVSDLWVDGNRKLTPQQEGGLFSSATYYAKFSENTASLTIQKNGWNAADENQTYLFRIVGTDENTKNIDLTVTVHENGKTTITNLPVGSYTVTEKSDWSWRYTPEEQSKSISLPYGGMTLQYNNTRSEEKWLDGDSYKNNVFNKYE